MASNRIDVPAFLEYSKNHVVIDVRSEGEYAHAHFPGAVSLPLFDNEERKIIGTAYKQQSKQVAIKLGLKYFGGKMVEMVEAVENLLATGTESGRKTVVVYCWRGGMRSGGVSWLLDLYGFKVYTLIGGYKAYRNWALQQLLKDYAIKIIGGYTGSGKTLVLHQLQQLGAKVLDLEGIARHKGSAFGNLGMPKQPSQEMFENSVAFELYKLDAATPADEKETESPMQATIVEQNQGFPESRDCIWVEDESQRIGLVNLPSVFFATMRKKPVYFLEIPFEQRLQQLVKEYGQHDRNELAAATKRIEKRLGGLETKHALQFLEDNDLTGAFGILLKYYDKQYFKGLHGRENLDQLLHKIEGSHVDPPLLAKEVLNNQKKNECQTYN